MRLKTVSLIFLTMLLLGILILRFNVQSVTANPVVDWWPMRGHDLNHTGYSTSTASTTNNTIWSYITGAEVYSSPAVVGGRVYVGSSDHKVYCIDALTGVHTWNYTTGSRVESSSPAVANGRVYVGSSDGKVYCLNASTGTHIWNFMTGDPVRSSPAVASGRVYVGSNDAMVYAFGTLVLSTDSVGNSKSTFDLTDYVYVRGDGFTTDTNVTVYLLPDGVAALPSNAVASASTTTKSTGDLPVTLVWSQPLTLGEYDIWADVNQNGIFDGGDVWKSQAIDIYTFNVIPELPTWTSILFVLILVTVASNTYKRKLLKNNRAREHACHNKYVAKGFNSHT